MKMASRQSGLTLIEIMVSLAIIGIISAIVLPGFVKNTEQSRIIECRNEVAAIRLAEEEFFITRNAYAPGVLDGINAITTLQVNLAGIYTPSRVASGANIPVGINPVCIYSVVLVPGPPAGYTITATGRGPLQQLGNVVVVNGP